jgi:hypothetical protein
MKVYVVYNAGYDFEYSETFVEFKVFANKADADAYREKRKTNDGYYWDALVEKVVE